MSVLANISGRVALIFVCFLTIFGLAAHAGGSSTGGGNLEEADFHATANALYAILSQDTERADGLLGQAGLVESFHEVLTEDATLVECALDQTTNKEILDLMREKNKALYYIEERQTIFIDCAKYQEELMDQTNTAKYTLVFHEYMRRLGSKENAYETSQKLGHALNVMSNDVPSAIFFQLGN